MMSNNEQQIQVTLYYNNVDVLALATHPATGLESYCSGAAQEEIRVRKSAEQLLAAKLDLLEVSYVFAN
tara:strand:+ start:111 stop:317 length:207 start_codon:yes stop_codon:yes gene_type:complete